MERVGKKTEVQSYQLDCSFGCQIDKIIEMSLNFNISKVYLN